jgi:phosphoribosyl-AMP cyclohydrolase / phosphoribosyl-ATP pyrophosphohydrolase
MGIEFLEKLETVISERKNNKTSNSYTASLFESGLDKILQKVGEESIEFLIDSKNQNKKRTCEEGADLLYHFMVALQAQGLSLSDIVSILEDRHKE